MTFVDSNVLIDVFSRDPHWFNWSAEQLLRASGGGGAVMNLIVFAELAPGYPTLEDLQSQIATASLRIAQLDESVAFSAGTTFAQWRKERRGVTQRKVLADFFIGAHAASLNMPLLTRDTAIYRRYFPDLPLITPETDHG